MTNEATLLHAQTPGRTEPQAPGRTENFYRKWRPISFAELYGQEHVARTLTNALSSGRVAHAYLLTGPRGTGKTTTGRLYAKALNCPQRRDGEPCNECESCLSYLAGRAMDLVELDAASNRGIDEIRGIRDKVAFAPGAGQYKIYLIDEVHMLTDAAFNALLKTLEEPPPHAVFMLATTEAHKVPATVLSRCQRFDFRRAPLAALVANLDRICAGEGLTVDPAALELIARSATGSHRDAVNVLDQLATSYGHELTLEHVRNGLGLIGDERSGRLARVALAGDLGAGLSLIASVRDDGLDLRQFQRELVAELRALLMAKSGLPPEDGATIERQRDLQEAVRDVPVSRLLVALRSFGEADLKQDPNSTLPLDIALANTALGPESTSVAAPAAQGAIGQSGNRANGAPPVQRPPVAEVAPPVRDSLAPLKNDPPPSNWAASEPPVQPSPTTTPAAPESRTVPEALEGPGAEASTSPDSALTSGSPPVTSGDLLTLEGVRSQMRAINALGRDRSKSLGAYLSSPCDIVAVNGAIVTLGLKFPAHVARFEKDAEVNRVFKEVLVAVLGRPMVVKVVHVPDVSDWKLREPQQSGSSARNPLVEMALGQGARIVNQPDQEEPERTPEE